MKKYTVEIRTNNDEVVYTTVVSAHSEDSALEFAYDEFINDSYAEIIDEEDDK